MEVIKKLKQSKNLRNHSSITEYMKTLIENPYSTFQDILATLSIADDFYLNFIIGPQWTSIMEFQYLEIVEQLTAKIDFSGILQSVIEERNNNYNTDIILDLLNNLVYRSLNFQEYHIENFDAVLNNGWSTYCHTLQLASLCKKINIQTRLLELSGLVLNSMFTNPDTYNTRYYVDVLAIQPSVVIGKRAFVELPNVTELSDRYQNYKNQIRREMISDRSTPPADARGLLKLHRLILCESRGNFIQIVRTVVGTISRMPKIDLNMLDSIFFFMTAAIEKLNYFEGDPMSSRSETTTNWTDRVLTAIMKIGRYLPIQDMLNCTNFERFHDQLNDLDFLLRGRRSPMSAPFRQSVNKLRYLRRRVEPDSLMTNRDPSLTGLLQVTPVLDKFQPKATIIPDFINPNSVNLWREKFNKFATLQSAMNVHDEGCSICKESHSQTADVAIFCVCDHVCCLPCTETWFGPTRNNDK